MSERWGTQRAAAAWQQRAFFDERLDGGDRVVQRIREPRAHALTAHNPGTRQSQRSCAINRQWAPSADSSATHSNIPSSCALTVGSPRLTARGRGRPIIPPTASARASAGPSSSCRARTYATTTARQRRRNTIYGEYLGVHLHAPLYRGGGPGQAEPAKFVRALLPMMRVFTRPHRAADTSVVAAHDGAAYADSGVLAAAFAWRRTAAALTRLLPCRAGANRARRDARSFINHAVGREGPNVAILAAP